MADDSELNSLRLELERLKDIEQTFEALFQKSPIGIAYHRVILGDDGEPVDYFFLDANANYLDLTGVDPRGKLVTEAFPGIENDPADWIGTFGRVAITGETIRFQQYLESVDRWYDAVGYQSSPFHFVAAFLEITETKKKEAELEHYRSHLEDLVAERTDELARALEAAEAANRAKTIFLANMSHELRTPLNAVLGYADILRSREVDERNRHYLQSIQRSGTALLAMINDVLDLSRIEAGRLETSEVAVEIRQLLDEISSMFAGQAGMKDLKLTVSSDNRVPRVVLSDPVRIRHILVNLVGNAIKFTDTGGIDVQVSGTPVGGERVHLDITVADTGKGIAEHDRERIFESFTQSTGQRPADFEGAGLGLAITRRVVSELNGTIKVGPNAGGGSVFRVRIPDIPVADASTHSAPEFDINSITLHGRQVLVVDDIEYNRDLLAAYLEPTGADCTLVPDAEAGLAAAFSTPPDIVLMDFKLPGMDGLEATRKLKANPATSGVPVVVVTASALPEDEARIPKVADAYLRKPVSRRDLLGEVASILGQAAGAAHDTPRRESVTDGVPTGPLVTRMAEVVKDGDFAALDELLTRATEAAGEETAFVREMRRLSRSYDDDGILRFLQGLGDD